MNLNRKHVLTILAFCIMYYANAQINLITNLEGRETVSLNGTWNYIIDPYETGFYNYRYGERNENDGEAYWSRPDVKNKIDRIEHGYESPYNIEVPGDWNSQKEVFEYYEGTVWYQRNFNLKTVKNNERVFIQFGAINYEAHVYLNEKKLGTHKGGFTPFNFEIPTNLLKKEGNFLVVKVDNKRHKEEIPTVNTDWWNYGGITRDVNLVIVPDNFIQNYSLTITQNQDIKSAINKGVFNLEGHIKLFKKESSTTVTIEIPELKITKKIIVNGDDATFHIKAKKLKLWSPESPKLYDVSLTFNDEKLKEKIGFRKIETIGKQIVLNGNPIFLRGICIHEEIAQDARRATSKKDAQQLLGYAKDLNANMVRLAHYPHNENMVRVADSLGILVWSEIPVYWTIDFKNKTVLDKAKKQLEEMVVRDQNRASVIIWSVGNETPVHKARTDFMKALIVKAKQLDNTRLISAALEVSNKNGLHKVDDPLGEFTDIVSINEYLGWYGGHPNDTQTASWDIAYNKPFFISETGAGAKGGFHADKETRWSEEYQEWFYQEQINMMKRMPDNFSGISPWILVDFKSPRRNHPKYQEGWNRKGLIDDKGNKKKAFYVLQEYYNELEKK